MQKIRNKAEDLPSNAPGLSRRERRRLRQFEKATGLDKSLDEIFEAVRHTPKAPVNRRHSAADDWLGLWVNGELIWTKNPKTST